MSDDNLELLALQSSMNLYGVEQKSYLKKMRETKFPHKAFWDLTPESRKRRAWTLVVGSIISVLVAIRIENLEILTRSGIPFHIALLLLAIGLLWLAIMWFTLMDESDPEKMVKGGIKVESGLMFADGLLHSFGVFLIFTALLEIKFNATFSPLKWYWGEVDLPILLLGLLMWVCSLSLNDFKRAVPAWIKHFVVATTDKDPFEDSSNVVSRSELQLEDNYYEY